MKRSTALLVLALVLALPAVVFGQSASAVQASNRPTTTDWIGAIAAGIAAVGTVGALFAALWQIGSERKARRRTEEETRARERSAQASKVSAWVASLDEGETPVAIFNQSETPVYEMIVSLVIVQGAGPRRGEDLSITDFGFRAYLSVVPPGESFTEVARGWGGMSRRPGVEIAFTDSDNGWWLRRANGILLELSQPPTDFYGLPWPLPWDVPRSSLEDLPSAGWRRYASSLPWWQRLREALREAIVRWRGPEVWNDVDDAVEMSTAEYDERGRIKVDEPDSP
jgi:hypothetical protein